MQAALAIEGDDPHTSVTLVHLACTGATIETGILGGYKGAPPQIDDARFLVGDREIDAVLVSIGGNDIGFADVIFACMLQEPCDQSSDVALGLDEPLLGVCEGGFMVFVAPNCRERVSGLLGLDETTGIEISEPGLAALPRKYESLDAALRNLLAEQAGRASGGPAPAGDTMVSRIVISEYPNASRDDASQSCGWEREANLLGELVQQLPFVTSGEFAWAELNVTQALNDIIAARADNGWTPVSGVFDAFERHGYCADDNWIVRLHESFLKQLDEMGSVHPNVAGYAAQGEEIAKALTATLYGSTTDLTSPRPPIEYPQVDPNLWNEFPVFGDEILTEFGAAVDIDRDVLVVADTRYVGDSDTDGAVYVYRFDGIRWVREAIVQAPPTGKDYREFGLDVAVSGNTLVVGAVPTGVDPVDGSANGITFVFEYDENSGEWRSQQTLPGSDYPSHAAVSIDGDIIAVGQPSAFGGVDEQIRFTRTGGVQLFFRTGSGWLPGPLLVPNMPQFNCIGKGIGFFGWDLELSGKGIAVGAPRDAKRVFLFHEMRSGTWICTGTSIDRLNGNPGWAVAYDGHRAVFGSPLSHDTDPDSEWMGAAFVFRDKGTLVEDGAATRAAASIARGGQFASSVAVRGDQILIGAPGVNAVSGGQAVGAAYLIRAAGRTEVLPQPRPTATGEGWGTAVAIGARGIVVSGPGVDRTGFNSGVVMVYRNDALEDELLVNSVQDAVDDAPGDGICATAEGLCTLRAAVQEANARPGKDLISLPGGTYELTLEGAGEDLAATGDLDVLEDLRIRGEGREQVVIDGMGWDRVIDTQLQSPVAIELVSLTIRDGAPPGNFASGGGIDLVKGSLWLSSVAVLNSSADRGGGVAVFDGDFLLIEDSLIAGNSAIHSGGGVSSFIAVTVNRTRMTGNHASLGGGIHVADGALIVNDSTFDANTAEDNGGGITTFRSPATLTNVTLSGNVAEIPNKDAGASLGNGSSLSFVTITGNVGVGLGGTNNTVTVENSVIAGNGQDCATDRFTILGTSPRLDSDGSCGFSITADPRLESLADNGGPTPTHALGGGSSAIDAARGACLAADQRGIRRPQGSACDLGAFELVDAPVQQVLGAVDLPIAAGFNQIGWVGPSTPVAEAVAHLDDVLLGVWVWDPELNAFLTYGPDSPSFLNTLTTLEYGAGTWILTSGASASASFPVLAPGSTHLGVATPTSILLREGFNLVAYPGTETAPGFGDRRKDPVDAIFAPLGDALLGVWRYDPDTASFLIYRPDLPAALNSLRTLSAGDAVWVLTAEEIEWNYLPALPAGVQAVDDGPFAVTGNITIDTATGTPLSLFDNDSGEGFVLGAFDAVSASGGAVSINSDGTFPYNPPAGLTGSDTFSYEITKDGDSDTAAVTLTINDMIWFIDNASGSPGDGRLKAPFKTLAAFQAVNGGGAADPGAGDAIFLHSGSAPYLGGLSLQTGQFLIGQGPGVDLPTATGIVLAPHSLSLPIPGGAAPVITNALGVGVELAGGNAVAGLIVDGGTVGLRASGLGGTVSCSTAAVI